MPEVQEVQKHSIECNNAELSAHVARSASDTAGEMFCTVLRVHLANNESVVDASSALQSASEGLLRVLLARLGRVRHRDAR
jgi:hypothetical protein